MSKQIGMLIPTRERINRVLTFTSSIITTVEDINNIQIYFGCDQDDPTLPIIKKIASALPCIRIIEFNNQGKFLGLGKMWNILADNCPEPIFFYGGEDMVFRTPNWDTQIIKSFSGENMPKDGIKLVHCNDNFHGDKLTINAFVGRKYRDVVGYFIREEFLINWSDQWLTKIFSAFDRKFYDGSIMIEHNHWVMQKNPYDKTAQRMMTVDKDNNGKSISDRLWDELYSERVMEAKKLAKYLGYEPNWSILK